jgi:hypothetical protein
VVKSGLILHPDRGDPRLDAGFQELSISFQDDLIVAATGARSRTAFVGNARDLSDFASFCRLKSI